MRVLVTGDRNWDKPFAIHTVLWGLAHQSWMKGQTLTIIQGGARGADLIAKEWAEARELERLEVECKTEEAHWKHDDWCPPDCRRVVGRAAGPIRNGEMLKHKPNIVVAFHDDLVNSKGTADMVRKARSANIPVLHIRRMMP